MPSRDLCARQETPLCAAEISVPGRDLCAQQRRGTRRNPKEPEGSQAPFVKQHRCRLKKKRKGKGKEKEKEEKGMERNKERNKERNGNNFKKAGYNLQKRRGYNPLLLTTN